MNKLQSGVQRTDVTGNPLIRGPPARALISHESKTKGLESNQVSIGKRRAVDRVDSVESSHGKKTGPSAKSATTGRAVD